MTKKIKFTDQALKQINKIVLENSPKKYFRISVLGGGCSGFKYNFTFDNKINNEGFDLIRSEWIAHAANLEKQIVARLGSTEIKGSFLKIDDNGTLVLKNSNGIKKITAADIHFEEN